jgi:hypothetical protein
VLPFVVPSQTMDNILKEYKWVGIARACEIIVDASVIPDKKLDCTVTIEVDMGSDDRSRVIRARLYRMPSTYGIETIVEETIALTSQTALSCGAIKAKFSSFVTNVMESIAPLNITKFQVEFYDGPSGRMRATQFTRGAIPSNEKDVAAAKLLLTKAMGTEPITSMVTCRTEDTIQSCIAHTGATLYSTGWSTKSKHTCDWDKDSHKRNIIAPCPVMGRIGYGFDVFWAEPEAGIIAGHRALASSTAHHRIVEILMLLQPCMRVKLS